MKLHGLTEIISEDKDFKKTEGINCHTIENFTKTYKVKSERCEI